MLGVAAVCIEEQPRRADHILSVVDAGKINLKSPLRYSGRLADEPEKLPWGAGYNIEFSGVDYEGLFVPASGGLRLSYIARTDHIGRLWRCTRETPSLFDARENAAGVSRRRSVRSAGVRVEARC